MNSKEVLEQYLWYNSSIKIESKLVGHKHLQGITKIGNIYNVNRKNFLTWEEMVREFGEKVGSYLNHHALVRAIPRRWKNMLKEDIWGDVASTDWQVIQNNQNAAKIAYNKFIVDKNQNDTARTQR